MARRPLIIRPVKINLCLPEDLHARLMLHLYSESEQRVPQGAIQRFFVDRLLEFFNTPKEF
jgi:hypothetical protein